MLRTYVKYATFTIKKYEESQYPLYMHTLVIKVTKIIVYWDNKKSAEFFILILNTILDRIS